MSVYLDEIDAWCAAESALKPVIDRLAGSQTARIERYGRCLLGVSSCAHRVDGGVMEVWDGERLAAVAYVTREAWNRSVLVVFEIPVMP